MLISIEKIFNSEQIQQIRSYLEEADWQDGKHTAGSIAQNVKTNLQLDDTKEPALSLSIEIVRQLSQNPVFISAALPNKIYPPKFNRYHDGGHYGNHIDGSLMQVPQSQQTLRTDLSATLFLSDPDEYEGGELTIQTQFGKQSVKLPAGDLVLYPSTSLHQVKPVTKGARFASFLWIQSLVRDNQQREYLYKLDQSVQNLTTELGNQHSEVVNLSGLYHNLMRQWADS